MLKTLTKLADRFDAEGKEDLANEVDNVISVFSARKKAPLKHLDEKVKKDLMGFVHKVEKNLKDSVDSLEELFRRLRYFDLGSLPKETGLDKTVLELKKIDECVDGAAKKIYELSFGKRPGKGDIEQMLDDEPDTDSLSFFESQVEPKEEEKEEPEKEEEEMPDDFWSGLEEEDSE